MNYYSHINLQMDLWWLQKNINPFNMRGLKDDLEYDTVNSVTLDSLELTPDVVVIDSCGFENEILYGMDNTLKCDPVLLINMWSNEKEKGNESPFHSRIYLQE